MERTSSERRLLAETSSYEQDMAAALASASAEQGDDNLREKARTGENPPPVRSISEIVSSPQLPATEGADRRGPRAHAYGRGGHRQTASEKFVRTSANGTNPNLTAASRSGIGNGGEREYLAAAGLEPYLGIHQILQPTPPPPPTTSSRPAGRGIADKMSRSSFRRMVGRTARRGGEAGKSSAVPEVQTKRPRRDSHEELELTNDTQRGNV